MRASADLTVSRLLQGRPLPLLGRVLSARREAGEIVLLDPQTGGELAESALPAFVLSTEHEATDRHILRQHWDLSRSSGAGVPVLWNHNPDVLLGQWRELEVRDLGGETGRALVGRADLDTESPLAAERRSQIRRGYLSAVSVRWQPGAIVRRGELDPADPLYREPESDFCDQPTEGFVMGSEAEPNQLIEASLTPIPADSRASVTERAYERGTVALQAASRGAPADLDALLTLLGQDPRVRAWASRLIRAELARTSSPAPASSPPRSVEDLFKRSH